MKTITAFKTEKKALIFSLITITLMVNAALMALSYLDMMRSARFAVSDIKQEIERNIEKNENIAAALGDLIALSDDEIVAKMGDGVNFKELEENQALYRKHIIFNNSEVNQSDKKISAILKAFWSNLSEDNKAANWTYFTSINRNYSFDFEAVHNNVHKYTTPHLELGSYLNDVSRKVHAEKEFWSPIVFTAISMKIPSRDYRSSPLACRLSPTI